MQRGAAPPVPTSPGGQMSDVSTDDSTDARLRELRQTVTHAASRERPQCQPANSIGLEVGSRRR